LNQAEAVGFHSAGNLAFDCLQNQKKAFYLNRIKAYFGGT